LYLRRLAAFCGVLRCFAAFSGVFRRFPVFSGVFQHFPAFSGVYRGIIFLWRGNLAIICGLLFDCFAAFCGILQHFAAFCGVLQHFAAFCGVFRRFLAFCGVLAISFHCGTKCFGGSNPHPLFWLVENNRAEIGGQWPSFPPENIFLVSSWETYEFARSFVFSVTNTTLFHKSS
jgi:hypothetical protein